MRIRIPGAEIYAPRHLIGDILLGIGARCYGCGEPAACISPSDVENSTLTPGKDAEYTCDDCCDHVSHGCRLIVENVEK